MRAMVLEAPGRALAPIDLPEPAGVAPCARCARKPCLAACPAAFGAVKKVSGEPVTATIPEAAAIIG